VAGYGILDELTQIPVGRHADVRDWFADVTGAIIGIVLAAGLHVTLRRWGRSPDR
jgi:VanZ family protein